MRILLSGVFALCFIFSYGQYKYDNVSFRTVYLEDLCKTLQGNPGYILVDVRSKGEHNDTASALNLNIGNLKSNLNIDIQKIAKRLHELDPWRDKPVFVYCSHSQRSRRVSKMLSDSGFNHVFNVNGGLTSLHLYQNKISLCPDVVPENHLSYKFVSPLELYEGAYNKTYSIIDIRKDSVFDGTTSEERKKAMGKLSGAINISLDKLSGRLTTLEKTKPILLVDDFGNESPIAANLLVNNGYKDVSVLFNGMDAAAQFKNYGLSKSGVQWMPSVKYQLLTSDDFKELYTHKKDLAIIDIREKEEFENNAKESWRNLGIIKDAVNIPYNDLKRDPMLPVEKDKTIILYALGNTAEVFEAARLLQENGYRNINVLLRGIFDLRWKAANLKGKSALKDLVVNVPEENL